MGLYNRVDRDRTTLRAFRDHKATSTMQSYCVCVFAFLLLGVTKLVSSVGESGSSSPLLVLSKFLL